MRDFVVNVSGVLSRPLEDAAFLRMHLFTISLKCNWDQAIAGVFIYLFPLSLSPSFSPFLPSFFPFFSFCYI